MVTQLQVLEAIYGPTTAYASWEIATAQRVLALFEPVAPKSLQVGDMLSTEQETTRTHQLAQRLSPSGRSAATVSGTRRMVAGTRAVECLTYARL